MINTILLQISQSGTDTAMNAINAIAGPAEQSISLWDMAEKGGPILIPIAIFSILAIYIFFERLFTIRRFSKIDMNFMHQIRDHVHSGNVESAKMLCQKTDSPVSRMIEKGIMRLGKPVKEIEGAIENVGKLEIYKMEKNLNILGTIAGIAPMFGFLGTIFGVIKIFYMISAQNSLEINTISGGLYVKMISSAAGLLVGMVAYACYHYLVHLIDRIINKMEINAVEFIDLLEEPVKN
ncbi:MAG: MotA/TolQ/ExbB proton channel family protein [Bacteroidetes bacterium]|nr:MAG: MotA/TolQ/ExbB proton channel family protein [Bacteroidota bacterium]REK03544.1 MAG: MotA/TolQ/ExbB proton channel family protein [Bacteroidota bacterium]REK34847.1 MAG: MotA/TolQ/ExbB proton channel family protein [Bacteroidota bacterium]REK51218.1 MAG: MotA/TolQ/ExbB proton channel family protein [Bacteroidota bacterium]